MSGPFGWIRCIYFLAYSDVFGVYTKIEEPLEGYFLYKDTYDPFDSRDVDIGTEFKLGIR